MVLEQVGVSRDHYLARSTLGRMSVERSKELITYKAKYLELYSENFDKCCKVQRQNYKGPVSLLQWLVWGSPVGFKDCQTQFIFWAMEWGKERTKDRKR